MINELVAYDTPAHAAQAVSQWHTSAATCPHTRVHSTVAGEPDLLMKIIQNNVDVATLPAAINAGTVESGTAVGLRTLRQRRWPPSPANASSRKNRCRYFHSY